MAHGLWIALIGLSLAATLGVGLLIFLIRTEVEVPILSGFNHSKITLKIRSHQTEVHYRLVGTDKSKPLVILIHGLGSSLASWRHLIPELIEDYRVLAFDLPGFGLSTDPGRAFGSDVALINEMTVKLLEELGLTSKPITVVGNSMGGVITLALMEHRPDLFTHSVLINPALSPRLVWLPIDQAQWLAGPLSKVVKKEFIRHLYHRTLANPLTLEPEALEFASSHFVGNAEGLRAFARYVRLIKNQPLRHVNSENCLLIFSEGDRVVTSRHRKAIRKLYPQATLLSHPSGGHQLQEDEPKWLKDQIRHFLNSHKA